MTVGIAVSGPMAGLAAYRALRAVELLGRGAIGGFVSFVAMSDGEIHPAETQRGGALALFGGQEPPEAIARAPLAGLMSSGPDRPVPLNQFTPSDPAAGIVTGHRLPNRAVPGAHAPNLAALSVLAGGASPETVVAEVLGAVPGADAGLIVMDLEGRIALGNSELVAARDDLGSALHHDAEAGLRIGILHNSIFPPGGLAIAAVAAAVDVTRPGDRVEEETLAIGLPLRPGSGRALLIAPDGAPLAATYAGSEPPGEAWEGSVVLRGDPVICDGLTVGRVTREVYCMTSREVVTGGRGGTHIGWVRIPAPVPA